MSSFSRGSLKPPKPFEPGPCLICDHTIKTKPRWPIESPFSAYFKEYQEHVCEPCIAELDNEYHGNLPGIGGTILSLFAFGFVDGFQSGQIRKQKALLAMLWIRLKRLERHILKADPES